MWFRTEQQTEGGLAAGLGSVEEGADQEAERNRGETEHEQKAQNGSETAVVEQPAGADDGEYQGQHEAQDDALGDKVTRPVGDIGQTHHAHGLLQAAALLKHDLHHDALDVDPESQRHKELLHASSSQEVKHLIEEDHEDEEKGRRKNHLQEVPLGLGGLQVSLP